MKLPKSNTNELSKYGFDWIAPKVIFQGPKKSNLAFCQFLKIGNFLKGSDNFSLFLVYSFLGMILTRDGFHWIIQKVIFKVGKVRFSPFFHNYWYYSVVAKCCPNLLHHVASLLWNQSCPKIWKAWNHCIGHFQGQKGAIWNFVIYFS